MSDQITASFLHPEQQKLEDVTESLVEFLGSAREEVAVAIYDFHVDGPPAAAIAEILQRLDGAGVRVRMVDHDERVNDYKSCIPCPQKPPEYIDSLGLGRAPRHRSLWTHASQVRRRRRHAPVDRFDELERGLVHPPGKLRDHDRRRADRTGLHDELRRSCGRARRSRGPASTTTLRSRSPRRASRSTSGRSSVRAGGQSWRPRSRRPSARRASAS